MNSTEQPEVKKSPAFFIPPINKEGYPIILIAGLGSLFLGIFSLSVGLLGFIITLFVLFFFRDPPRMVPKNDNLVVSPADGIVAEIAEVNCFPPELAIEESELVRISIFLSILDVHVNRIPVAGIVKALIYIPGVFSNAFFSQSSFKNERQIVLIENNKQEKFVVVQIAGLAARRVVCKLNSGQKVAQGSRFGIIKFGSRVDVYLPRSYAVRVVYGQVLTGGETVLALPSGNSFVADDFSII